MLIQAFAVFLLFACTSTQEAAALEGVSYAICPAGSIPDDNNFLVPGQSTLECVQRCSEDDGCAGVTVCPVITTDQLRCRFMSQACEPSTQEASGSLCKHFQKMGSLSLNDGDETVTPTSHRETALNTPDTTELLCQNGGTPNGDRCHCPIQYGGKLCHRMIRDCKEPYKDGYDQKENSGVYNIKPTDAASAFPVRCDFRYGTTIFMKRGEHDNFDKDWSTYKRGFGTDQLAGNVWASFFIGLENLYHLLKQGHFQVNVYTKYPGAHNGSFYRNFSLGPESSSYEIRYDLIDFTHNSPFGDGFFGSTPMVFSANGHDANGCYRSDSKAGWYDANCTGYGMFSNGSLVWPLKTGNDFVVDSMELQAVRWKPAFYHD